MTERTLEVINRAGIHTRPAALIVKHSQHFQSQITFIKDDMTVNGKSIMGIITLGCPYGDKIKMICEGPDETELADAISKLFSNRFEEE